MLHSSTSHRPTTVRARAIGLSILLALTLLAGCDYYRPLALAPGRTDGNQSSESAGGPQTAADANENQPANVQAGQDDLAAKVREYTERLDKQHPAVADAAGPRPLKQPGTGGQIGKTSARLERRPTLPRVAMAPGPSSGEAGQVIGEPPAGNPALDQASEAATPPAAAAAAGGLAADPTQPGPPVVLASSPVVGMLASELTDPVHPPAGAAAARVPARPEIQTNVSVPEAAQPKTQPGLPDKTLADAIAEAEKTAASQPADFRTQLQLRMLYLAAGRTRDAQTPWSGGTAADRQMLSAWVEAAIALGNNAAAAESADPHDAALAAVDRLRSHLAEQAALKIRTIKLASRVDGFGVVVPFEGDAYRPGQWVIVYCELENLVSKLDADARYRTELSLHLELLTADGKSVLRQDDPQVVDRSLNQRRDFFLARRLRMPADLAVGHYVLRVSIEDKQAAKVGESMLKFQVR